LEYIGYGKVAPAPVSETCALALDPARTTSVAGKITASLLRAVLR